MPPPIEAIGSFRTIKGMPDIGSGPARSRSDGTLAFLEVDGQAIFGVNADAPGYTVRDEAKARDMRARLIEQYPDLMATGNIGHKPNDALLHAEAVNALLRAVEPYGGTLAGRTIELRVDRRLCPRPPSSGPVRFAVRHPRQEPSARIWPVWICAGRLETAVPAAIATAQIHSPRAPEC